MNRGSTIVWRGYILSITQAGVGLGLAKEVGVEFMDGRRVYHAAGGYHRHQSIDRAAVFQVCHRPSGEAHPRAQKLNDGDRDAVIFGIDNQSRALARQLLANQWGVLLVGYGTDGYDAIDSDDIPVRMISDYSAETLLGIGVQHAETAVMLHNDDDNYNVCEIVYGTIWHEQCNCAHQ